MPHPGVAGHPVLGRVLSMLTRRMVGGGVGGNAGSAVKGRRAVLRVSAGLAVTVVVVSNLGAVALNAATSVQSRWPAGLEAIHRHPFRWSAGLTVIAVVV